MNHRQINEVSSQFPHGADELDLAPEALKDLAAGASGHPHMNQDHGSGVNMKTTMKSLRRRYVGGAIALAAMLGLAAASAPARALTPTAVPLTPGDLLGQGIGETVGGLTCDPARTATESLGKLAEAVSDLLCNTGVLDFTVYTVYKRLDGTSVKRETRTTLALPTPVEVGDGDLLPDLTVTITPLSTSRLRVRIDRAPLEAAPLPVSVEAIANDPTTGQKLPRKRVAFGYDARASRAPQSFETEIRVGNSASEPGATTLGVGYETRVPGTTMDVIGGIFNGTPQARTDPIGVRMNYKPVPTEAGLDLVIGKKTAGLQKISMRKTTVSPTKLTVHGEAVEGPSELRVDAVVDKLPAFVETTYEPFALDRRKVVYKAAAAVGRFTLDYTDKSGGTLTQAATVKASALPTGMTLEQTSKKAATFEATGGSVGSVEVGYAQNGPPRLLAGATKPYGYVFEEDKPNSDDDPNSYAGRVDGLRKARFDGSEPIVVDAEIAARTPFVFKVDTPAFKADGDLQDLPRHVRAVVDLAGGQIDYDGFGDPIERVTVAEATKPTGFFPSSELLKRVTRISGTVRQLSPKVVVTLKPKSAAGAGFSASAPIGSIEALLTSGNRSSLPPGESGFKVQDLPDRFTAFGRINGLSEVNVTSDANGKLTGSAKVARQKLHLVYESVPTNLGLTTVDASLSEVPDDIVVTFDPSAGKATYRAMQGIDALKATLTAAQPLFGQVRRIGANVEGIPAALDIGFKPDSGSGGSFTACPEPSPGQPVLVRCDGVDLIEVELTDGAALVEGDKLPAERSGVKLSAFPTQFKMFVRLQEVIGVTFTSSNGNVRGSVDTGPLPDAGKQSFDVDATFPRANGSTQPPAKVVTNISELPSHVEVDQGASKITYKASDPIPSVEVDAWDLNGQEKGAINRVDATLTGVPKDFALHIGDTNGVTVTDGRFERIQASLWDLGDPIPAPVEDTRNKVLVNTRDRSLKVFLRVFGLKKAVLSEALGNMTIDTEFASPPAPLEFQLLNKAGTPAADSSINITAKEIPTETKITVGESGVVQGQPVIGTYLGYDANGGTADVHAEIRTPKAVALLDLPDIPAHSHFCFGEEIDCGSAPERQTFWAQDDDVNGGSDLTLMPNDVNIVTDSDGLLRLSGKICLPPTNDKGTPISGASAPYHCAPHTNRFITIDELRVKNTRLEFASGLALNDDDDGGGPGEDGLLKLYVDSDATGIKVRDFRSVNTFSNDVMHIVKDGDPPFRNVIEGRPFFMVLDLDTNFTPFDKPAIEQYNGEQIDCRNLYVAPKILGVERNVIPVIGALQGSPVVPDICSF